MHAQFRIFFLSNNVGCLDGVEVKSWICNRECLGSYPGDDRCQVYTLLPSDILSGNAGKTLTPGLFIDRHRAVWLTFLAWPPGVVYRDGCVYSQCCSEYTKYGADIAQKFSIARGWYQMATLHIVVWWQIIKVLPKNPKYGTVCVAINTHIRR